MKSTGISIDLARERAEFFVERLRPFCVNCEIAGSIRRGKSIVGDIEIVAEQGESVADFYTAIYEMELCNELSWYRDSDCKNGMKYLSRKTLIAGEVVGVDIFVVTPPAQWGVIFAIRTGSHDFNVGTLVPAIKRRGLRSSEGRLQQLAGEPDLFGAPGWRDVPTPTEGSFFAALGLKWIDPKERN